MAPVTTAAERKRLWRRRHALPIPTETLSDEVFSYAQDPVMRALLMEEVALLEAALEQEGVEDDEA